MRILFNHLGFDAAASKRVLLQARELGGGELVLLDEARREVARAALRPLGGVPGWGEWRYWQATFGPIERPGRGGYQFWLPGSEPPLVSAPFAIGDGQFGAPLLSDLLNYFKSQRASGLYDFADRSAKVFGCDERRDARGGWYDASGDCSKYLTHLSYANFLNPQQTPLLVWNLLAARDALPPQPKWFAERMVDEALHGADFLLRMQHPDGFFYQTLFDGWSKDETRRELCAYATQQGQRLESYRAGWRQGGGMAIAALARASGLPRDGEAARGDYLAAARRGFAHLERHGDAYLPDGSENLIDDYCALLAACELYAASGAAEYERAAASRIAAMLARQDERGWWMDAARQRSFVHASDAGLPYLAILRFLRLFPDGEAAGAAQAGLRRGLAAELARATGDGNPFGYPRQWVAQPGRAAREQFFAPQDNGSGYWWQGENARLASLAAAAWGAARQLREAALSPGLDAYAQGALDWILGRNPFDVCMLQGHGRNNPQYEPGYFNAAGGVCNGITAAPGDEEGIAFLLPEETDISQSWRWSEQWLPHAAWLLLALALRPA